ncbi:hypothetical protein H5410_062879 [Solanum commersonii]|uniref:BACK domain-containing protein n=1 Tax=Solanum commersonii TaxID=4109 RepID=A0A9J5WBU6_SOLCO|nr:hypothetical protein H5410_062879 [Solanum commersonii]
MFARSVTCSKWPSGLGLILPCWRSQVRKPLPAKARDLPSGSSSLHRACLVRVISPMWFVSYCTGAGVLPCAHAAAEEAAFMDLLKFMYSNTLSTITPTALLDVLMAADKFEVASCMRHCSRLLLNVPMTCESALLYLDLPSSVSIADAVRPLIDAAKQFLAAHFKDITKFQEEVLNLPLAGIEAVLSNDDLQVASEDAVCDFVLKWARTHYPNLEERREILGSRLCRLIRFPYLTCRKLRKVLTCNDFDPELASKDVLEALFFKAEAPRPAALTCC